MWLISKTNGERGGVYCFCSIFNGMPVFVLDNVLSIPVYLRCEKQLFNKQF